ncbi:hypothetical protein [Acidaminococcus fermentans]|uniref:hypothetical protein n=1 Tax=Acidaminococcus fermentans TaxID=905 RepID=UPI00242EC69F|nr:hypothetical protein [Acidaminococcus fermentans]
MKIFESIQNDYLNTKVSPIKSLLNNDLRLHDKLENLGDSISTVKSIPNGENELITLLFSGIGGKVYIPRKGDNNERFDAIITFPEYKVITEIEIPSTEILDAPRNLLDDYAVVHCRKSGENKSIIPLVVCWDLPNRRTDYWNVITDINSVLGLKIKTISIVALALYYLTGTPLDFSNNDFFLNHDNSAMLSSKALLEKNGMSISDFPGYFEPYK